MENPVLSDNIQQPEQPYRRKTWVTVLLHFLDPALPFVYNGSLKRAIIVALILSLVGIPLAPLAGISFAWLVLLVTAATIAWFAILAYSIRSSRKGDKLGIPRVGRLWPKIILLLIGSAILPEISEVLIKAYIIQAYKIPAGSMEKTLLVGDYFLAPKNIDPDKIVPDDIIIFQYPGDTRQNFVKRCVAVEGQSIRIADKQVFVDGKPEELAPGIQYIDNDHIKPYSIAGQRLRTKAGEVWYTEGRRDNMPETIVPEGMLFVLGDNRDNSSDSRFWGFLDKDLVFGKAQFIHFSWQPYDPSDPNLDFPEPPQLTGNPISWIKNLAFNVYYFPKRVRWERPGMEIK